MGVAKSPGRRGDGNAAGSSDATGDELGAGAFLSLVRGGALLKAQNLRRGAVRFSKKERWLQCQFYRFW